MKLGMEVVLGPGHIVLDEDSASPKMGPKLAPLAAKPNLLPKP